MPVSKRAVLPELRLYWRSECGRAVVYVGDCRKILAQLDKEQFHAVVTDPPYGLEFMGLEFDAPWNQNGSVDARQHRPDEMTDPVKAKYLRHNVRYGLHKPRAYQEWFEQCAAEILRVAKPGAHLLAFGGTRMWHRMACAIEDAGWDIRDTLGWVYGSGFPKSMDISKQIDKMHGVEREVIGNGTAALSQGQFNSREVGNGGYGYSAEYDVTAPTTEDAKRWSGWGTALKPAFEPIVMARKPMDCNTAENTLEHGCGGLNIDACKIGAEVRVNGARGTQSDGWGFKAGASESVVSGRWPANLIHDGSDEVLAVFPDTKSQRSTVTSTPGSIYGAGNGLPSHTGTYGFDDSGSAARLFYSAKADESDRPHGKDGTVHPTVKPQSLMSYLVRLVCVRGGTVLDPFMGSGSTGCATLAEGMKFVGVEQSQEYADIAIGRLRLALSTAPPPVDLKTREAVNIDKDIPPPPTRLVLE